jgi:hypothetical protein
LRDLEPLALAAIIGMLTIAVLATIDLAQDGKLDSSILALLAGYFTPLMAAFVAKRREPPPPPKPPVRKRRPPPKRPPPAGRR